MGLVPGKLRAPTSFEVPLPHRVDVSLPAQPPVGCVFHVGFAAETRCTERLEPWSEPGPRIPAQFDCVSPALAVHRVFESQWSAGRPTRPLLEVRCAICRVDEVVVALANRVAGEEGQRLEIRSAPHATRIEVVLPKQVPVVGNVLARVTQKAAEREQRSLLVFLWAVPLTLGQVGRCQCRAGAMTCSQPGIRLLEGCGIAVV